MLKSTTSLISICFRNSFKITNQSRYFLKPLNSFRFCKNKHDKHHEHQEKKHQEHVHGPNCNHHHHHQHKHQHTQTEHKHGPNCNHDHDHHGHDHHAAHPNVKLSKLSFEQLIELDTPQSLKYAHLIYEQESKRLNEIKNQRQHLLKNKAFYQKVEQDIKQKQKKLEQNIKNCAQQAQLSRKRAQKQVEQSKNFAVTKIAKQLLQVADCITSCKAFAQKYENKDKYIQLIISSKDVMNNILKQFDIQQFDPINQEYDPNTQQSLLQIPTPPGYTNNHVATVMRTGYKIKGRLLRSARVGIFN